MQLSTNQTHPRNGNTPVQTLVEEIIGKIAEGGNFSKASKQNFFSGCFLDRN